MGAPSQSTAPARLVGPPGTGAPGSRAASTPAGTPRSGPLVGRSPGWTGAPGTGGERLRGLRTPQELLAQSQAAIEACERGSLVSSPRVDFADAPRSARLTGRSRTSSMHTAALAIAGEGGVPGSDVAFRPVSGSSVMGSTFEHTEYLRKQKQFREALRAGQAFERPHFTSTWSRSVFDVFNNFRDPERVFFTSRKVWRTTGFDRDTRTNAFAGQIDIVHGLGQRPS
mmetsp:Transcript_28987/g.65919  ORF Transcript_28987/g.65919 Transcript_28987/m.65919 type:complete len:227 (+) Transcript_28987:21-701(+)